MRIAFVVGKFPSISETFILNQITGLIDAGHEVDIFAFKSSDDSKEHTDIRDYRLMERTHYIEIPREKRRRVLKAVAAFARLLVVAPAQALQAVNVFRFGREAASLSLLLTLSAFAQKSTYDILYCHFGKQGLRGMRLKQMGVRGKLVVIFHGYDVSQVMEENGPDMYACLFETADLLMPVSLFWQHKLVALGADPNRVRVHHMGIDVERFEFQPRMPDSAGYVQLFTVGRLVEKKGIEFSIRAVGRVLEKHPELKVRYLVMGDGPLCKDLEALVDSLGLEHVVQLLGSGTQEDVQRHMGESHLFLLPSITAQDGDMEGIPVSMMEAMAAGMPVI
jgi:colanic acid/amylovoran biosynthesis glycosyltransferase